MKVLKGFLNVISIIICIALSVAIFAVEMGIHTVLNTSNFVSKENIKGIIMNVDFEDYLTSFSESNPDFEEELKDSLAETGIDYETITYIMNSKEVKEVVGDYISSTVDAILNDGEVKKPTVDQVMSIIEDNEELLDKIAEKEGVKITPKEKEELLNSIRESMPEVIEQLPDITDELKEDNESITTIREVSKIFSITTVLALLGVVVLLYLIISLLRWSFHKSMLWLAVPTVLSSLAVIVLSLSLGLVKAILGEAGEMFAVLGETLITNLFKHFLISGIIGLVIGIALIAGFIAICVHKNKKAQNVVG